MKRTITKMSLVGHGAKFGTKMNQAIVALMTKSSVEEAAKTVGISANTLIRWTKDTRFKVAYDEARHTVFSQSIARLQDATNSAVTTLIEITRDKKTTTMIRMRAADMILCHAERGINVLSGKYIDRDRTVEKSGRTRLST
jgi:hypothetical protein